MMSLDKIIYVLYEFCVFAVEPFTQKNFVFVVMGFEICMTLVVMDGGIKFFTERFLVKTFML